MALLRVRLELSEERRRASAAKLFQQQCRWDNFFSNTFTGAAFAIVSEFRVILPCQHLRGSRNRKSEASL
jgi:hypothetical protein